MISNAPHARRLALVGAVAALALMGCPSPSIYGTARTIPRGQIQQTVAVEGLGATTSGASGFVPTLPTYQFRIGLPTTSTSACACPTSRRWAPT